MNSYLLLFMLFAFGLSPIQAQQPYAWQIDSEQGLPSMEVYDLFQDSWGYVWIATNGGVVRYDGYNMQTFTSALQRGRAFTDIREDAKGRIWLRNFNGQLFYIEQDSMYNIPIPDSIPVSPYSIYRLEGERWLWVTADNLYRYDMLHETWAQLSNSYDSSYFMHYWLGLEQDIGGMKAVSRDQLFIIKSGQVVKQEKLAEQKWLSARLVSTAEGLFLWDSNERALFRLSHQRWEKVRAYELPPNVFVLGLRKDAKGRIWLACSRGLRLLYVPEGISNRPDILLPDYAISDIMLDEEGMIWIATLTDGVFVIPAAAVLVYDEEALNTRTLAVTGLAASPSHMYIATYDGALTMVDTALRIKEQYLPSIIKNILTFAADDKNQQIYLAVDKLYRINQKNFGKTKTPVLDILPPRDMIIYRDSLWFVSNYGVGRLALKEQRPLPANCFFKKKGGRTIWGDREQPQIWVGHSDSLCWYSSEGEGSVWDEAAQRPILANTMTQTADGTLWVGTIENGIYGIRQHKVVEHITTSKGLLSNFCKVLLAQGDSLWLATDHGVQLWLPQHQKGLAYTVHDGIPSKNISSLVLWKQKLWVGTEKGLACIPLDYNPINTTRPKVYLQSIALWEKDTLLSSPAELSYNQNNIKIQFQSLSFRSKGQFSYRYRLLGVDTQWTQSPASNAIARYPLLPPGEYTFELLAVNEDGLASAQPVYFSFHIRPPFWQQAWFLVLTALASLSIMAVLFRWWFKNQQRKSSLQNRIKVLRMQALQAQMNPHFVFNALSAIQYFFVHNEEEAALSYLSRFAKLIRLIFEQSKCTLISIAEELELLKLYVSLELLRFNHKIELSWEIAPQLLLQNGRIPPLLLQPIVENAFKHGLLHQKESPLHLSIQMHYQAPHTLHCCVVDTGVGRKKAAAMGTRAFQKHESAGMHTTEARLALYNQTAAGRLACPPPPKNVEVLDGKRGGQPLGTAVHLWILLQ